MLHSQSGTPYAFGHVGSRKVFWVAPHNGLDGGELIVHGLAGCWAKPWILL
jgi:hypothetical protein